MPRICLENLPEEAIRLHELARLEKASANAKVCASEIMASLIFPFYGYFESWVERAIDWRIMDITTNATTNYHILAGDILLTASLVKAT